MDIFHALVDFVLHVDQHLFHLVSEYGVWTYGILLLIVFCETGLIVTPFLPGDSLLFAAGALAAGALLDVHLLFVLLTGAAVAGDAVNYWIGRRAGGLLLARETRLLNRSHLERTQQFYDRHGGKTIVLARFLPIVRTFAPFVAGIGRMEYRRFFVYNLGGGVLWIALFLYGGFFFGSLPVVKENFSLVIVAIIVVSIVPVAVELLRSRFPAPRAAGRTAA